jgi:outer membrane protein assembly factor BamE (lipoprotein component of BamABCDE complex)
MSNGSCVLGWLICGLLSFLVSSTGCGDPAMFKDEYEKLRAVQVGWTEDQVRTHLGAPWKVFRRESAPEHYYVEGWCYKKRPISNKVWIYLTDEAIAYVYFDDRDRVEDVFVGGS